MSNNIEALEAFLNNDENFISKLRSLDGLDKSSIDYFIGILNGIGDEIRNERLIEKRLAYFLIDIEPTLLSIASTYSGDIYQEILKEIGRISMTINEILES